MMVQTGIIIEREGALRYDYVSFTPYLTEFFWKAIHVAAIHKRKVKDAL